MEVDDSDSKSPAQSVATETTAYPLTARAFEALINVETLTGILAQELARCERSLSDLSMLPDGFWYVAEPDDDMPEEFRAFRKQQRADHPPEFKPYWGWIDHYHLVRVRWRRSLHKARAAVNAAIVELDYATTPPLERTSAGILRTIQELHLTVPDPIWHGDYPPITGNRAKRLTDQLPAIGRWVDELRIVRDSTIVPVKQLPADNEKQLAKEAAQRERRRERLVGADSDGRAILRYMAKHLLKSAAEAKKATALIPPALHRGWKRGDKDLFIRLAREGLLHSEPGTGGGYWITEEGILLVGERPK